MTSYSVIFFSSSIYSVRFAISQNSGLSSLRVPIPKTEEEKHNNIEKYQVLEIPKHCVDHVDNRSESWVDSQIEESFADHY
jgi:hypothetical protein